MNYNYMPNNLYTSQSYQPQSQLPQAQMLNGKIVENEDMVKIAEVPIGGYGVYPLFDFSGVYIKSWNTNGTTNLIKYEPVKSEPKEDITQTILDRIKELENKIDMFCKPKQEKKVNLSDL